MLRGLLLTGRQPRYLRHELIGGLGRTDVTGYEPLWWPPAKIAARHLAPFLAAFAGVEAPADDTPGDGAISIDVDVTQSKLDLLTPRGPVDPEADGDTVAEAMTSEMLVVAPEDTLGEVAGRMRGLRHRLGDRRGARAVDRHFHLARPAAGLCGARSSERGAHTRVDDG